MALEDRLVVEILAAAVGGAEDSATAAFKLLNAGEVTTEGLATGAMVGWGLDTDDSTT